MSRLSSSLNFAVLKPNDKSLSDFLRMLFNKWQELSTLINGNVSYGDGTNTDNISGAWSNVTAPVAPNTDFTITHNLGRLPVGYITMQKDRACDVYTGSVVATKTQITLRATVASAVLRIFIICALLSVLSGRSFAQGSPYHDIALYNAGTAVRVVPSATITVCASTTVQIPCSPLASIFSNAALTTPLPNPTSADANGNFSFFSTPGSYVIVIGGAGVQPYAFPQVVPSSTGTFTGILPNSSTACLSSMSFAATASISYSVLLNCNVTSSNIAGSPVNGNLLSLTLTEDGVGGRTFAFPANFIIPPGYIFDTVATHINALTFKYDGTNWNLLSNSGSGGSPPLGNNGDLQAKNGTALAASHINDNGATLFIKEDSVICGQNPIIDVRCYGARLGFSGHPFTPGDTATIANGSAVATVTNPTDFFNGDPVVIFGPGPSQAMSTPAAPTVVASLEAAPLRTGYTVPAPAGGATTTCYRLVAVDKGGGYTAASSETCVTGQTLGVKTVAVSSATRINNVVTITTSAVHGLAIGAMVIFNGTDFETVNSVIDTTHFTYLSQQDTRYGGSNSASWTSLTYWYDNTIQAPAYSGTQWLFAIYAGATNAEVLYGFILPNSPGYQDDSTALLFDDVGASWSGQLFPYYLPTNYPTSPSADIYTGTIVSGGQTSTITLSSTAANAVCAGGGCSILYDFGQAWKAADAVATASGGMIYIPVNTAGFFFAVNSPYIDITNDTSAAGNVRANGIVQLDGKLFGDRTSNKPAQGTPQFTIEPQLTFFEGNSPVGYLLNGQTVSGIGFAGATNGIAAMVVNGQNSFVTDHSYYTSQGAMGVGLYNFRSYLNSGFGFHASNTNFTSGAGGLTEPTPVYISKNESEELFDVAACSKHGFFWSPPPFGWFGVEFNQGSFECQGPTMPIFTIINENGSGINGYFRVRNGNQDTSTVVVIANLSNASVLGHFKGSVSVQGAGGISLSGAPFGSVDITDVAIVTSCHNIVGIANAHCRNNGSNLEYANVATTVQGWNSALNISGHNVQLQNSGIYDNFNRANGAIAGVAGNGVCNTWDIGSAPNGGGGLNISSNTVVPTDAGGSNKPYQAVCDAPGFQLAAVGQFAQGTVTAFHSTDYVGVSVLAKPGTSFAGTALYCTEGNSLLNFDACRTSNGCSSGGVYGTTALTPAIGDVIRIEAIPVPGSSTTTVSCSSTSKSGVVTTLNVTDPGTGFDNTSGNPGIMFISTGVGNGLDNWSGGYLNAGGQLNAEQDWLRPQHFDSTVIAAGTTQLGANPGSSGCGTVAGCLSFLEGPTTAPAAAGADTMRADSTTHSLRCSFNGGTETSCGGGPSYSTVTDPLNYGAKFDTKMVWDAAFTSGSSTVTCPNSDCSFTSADLGKIAFGTNPAINIEAAGSVVVPQGFVCTINNANSVTLGATYPGCGANNATANCTFNTPVNQGCLFIWGHDDTAGLQSAWSAAVNSSVCAALILPVGNTLVQQGQFNTNPTLRGPCRTGAGNAWQGAAISGISSSFAASMIIPTPNFDFTTCTGGVDGKSCFLGSNSMYATNFAIFGAGNALSGCSATTAGKIGVEFDGGSVAADAYGVNLAFTGWGSQCINASQAFIGVETASASMVGLTNMWVTGFGYTPCVFNSGFSVNEYTTMYGGACVGGTGTESPASWPSGLYLGKTAGDAGYVLSYGGIYGNGQGSTENGIRFVASTSVKFYSYGDQLGQNTSSVNHVNTILIPAGCPNCAAWLDGDNLQNTGGNTGGVSSGLNCSSGAIHIHGTNISNTGTGSLAIATASGCSIFDDGGNIISGAGGNSIAAGTLFGSNSITGTVQTSGNWSVPAGSGAGQWGTSPSVATCSGNSIVEQCTITVGSGTVGASPVLTITWPTAFIAAPSCDARMIGGTATFQNFVTGAISTTTGAFTYNGTPAASSTIILKVSCSN